MSTIACFPQSAYAPTSNCVGIGDVLRRRGHRVVFIVGRFCKDFIRETAHDHAQRMHETGLGIRLDTCHHAAEQLTQAIEPLHERLAAVSTRLAATPRTVTAAGPIDRLAADAPRDHQ